MLCRWWFTVYALVWGLGSQGSEGIPPECLTRMLELGYQLQVPSYAGPATNTHTLIVDRFFRSAAIAQNHSQLARLLSLEGFERFYGRWVRVGGIIGAFSHQQLMELERNGRLLPYGFGFHMGEPSRPIVLLNPYYVDTDPEISLLLGMVEAYVLHQLKYHPEWIDRIIARLPPEWQTVGFVDEDDVEPTEEKQREAVRKLTAEMAATFANVSSYRQLRNTFVDVRSKDLEIIFKGIQANRTTLDSAVVAHVADDTGYSDPKMLALSIALRESSVLIEMGLTSICFGPF